MKAFIALLSIFLMMLSYVSSEAKAPPPDEIITLDVKGECQGFTSTALAANWLQPEKHEYLSDLDHSSNIKSNYAHSLKTLHYSELGYNKKCLCS